MNYNIYVIISIEINKNKNIIENNYLKKTNKCIKIKILYLNIHFFNAF